jgi:hypothetical protein
MKNSEVHPIELALVAGLVVLEAVVVLVAAVVALVVTLAQWMPAPAPSPAPAAPAPAQPGSLQAEPEPIQAQAQPQLHPLALIATQLQALPVATLREMAHTRSKTVRKAQLIELIACS